MSFDVKAEVAKAFPCTCAQHWVDQGHHKLDNDCYHWPSIEHLLRRAMEAAEKQCIQDACPICRVGENAPIQGKGGNWYHRILGRRRGQFGPSRQRHRCLASDILQLSWHRKESQDG